MQAVGELPAGSTSSQVAEHAGLQSGKHANDALMQARVYGLVTAEQSAGKTRRQNRWTLTPLGRAYCDGRVRAVTRHPGGREFLPVCPHCGCVPA